MEHILQKIMCVTIILLSAVYSVSAVGPETTTIYCQGGEIPGVPRRIVELSGTFTHQMEDAGSSKEVLSMQSCEDTQAFIELLERSIPPELQSDPHAKLLGDAEPVIQKNIVQNLTQKLSCNSLNLFHSVLSFIETGNYLDCPVVRHGAEEALVRYVTEADNVDYFVEHPQYYGAMMQALNEKPQEIHDEMRDVLMSSRVDLNNFYQKYTLGNQYSKITSVAYSPDGKRLVSGSEDGIVDLWNLENGKLSRRLYDQGNWVTSVAYSPDGKYIAFSLSTEAIIICDLESGDFMRTFQGHTEWVNAVAYSPDGQQLASGSQDHTIRIWNPNLEDGNPIGTLAGHTRWVNSIAYSPDGKQLASGSADGTVRIWDLESESTLRILEGDRKICMNSVAYSPNGKQIAAGSNDRTIKVWDVEEGQLLKIFGGYGDGVTSVAYNPDGKQLAGGSNGGIVKIWDLEREDVHRTLKDDKISRINSLAYSSDGTQLASGSYDHITIWQFQPKKFITCLSLPQLMLYILLTNVEGKEIIARELLADLIIELDMILQNACVVGNVSAQELQEYRQSLAHVELIVLPKNLK